MLPAFLAGCGGLIIPPASPAHPVVVYVTDYGRHSTLVLPTDSGGLVEYAFGEWGWLARMERQWYRAVAALFFADGSAFGRRFIPQTPALDDFTRILDTRSFVAVSVDRERMAALRDKLDAQYRRLESTAIFSHDGGFFYVHDKTAYWLYHNCNHATAEWLRELGCQVKGPCVTSKFKLKK